MHEANFELIEIPHVRQSGKNSADIRLVVDALDLCYTKAHVNTFFVIISGDSDFSPLVSKLRENAKQVIGVGVKQSTSDSPVANCDEFIFYDDLVPQSCRMGRQTRRARKPGCGRQALARRRSAPQGKIEVAQDRGDRDGRRDLRRAGLGTGRQRQDLGFDAERSDQAPQTSLQQSIYGFRTFGNLLEEAQTRGLLNLAADEKSGAYVYRSSALGACSFSLCAGECASVERGQSLAGDTAVMTEEGNPREGGSRRDSRRNGRGGRKQNEHRRSEAAPQAFVPVADAEVGVVHPSGC